MRHDRLCDYKKCHDPTCLPSGERHIHGCVCEFIDKVRVDERGQSADEFSKYEDNIRAEERKHVLARIDGVFVDDAVSWNRALLAAIAAIKGEW